MKIIFTIFELSSSSSTAIVTSSVKFLTKDLSRLSGETTFHQRNSALSVYSTIILF